MTDDSLLKDLELFQELSDREVKAVTGGLDIDNIKLKPGIDIKLGGCPACLSGIDPWVLEKDYLEVISIPSTPVL